MLKLLQKIYNSSGASWEYMERESAFIFLHLENQEPCQENIKKTGLYLEWHSFKMSSVSPSCSDFWLLYGMMIMLCCWDLSTNINIILLPFVKSQSGIHQYFFLYQQQIWIPQLGPLFASFRICTTLCRAHLIDFNLKYTNMKLLITVATHDSINLTELYNMGNEAVINVVGHIMAHFQST